MRIWLCFVMVSIVVAAAMPPVAAADTVGAIQPRQIDPMETDLPITSAITKPAWGFHLAWPVERSRSPGSVSNSLLYLFLPATGATPSDYTLIQQEAVDLGYHVIGLAYPNTDAVVGICHDPMRNLSYEDRQACYLNVRQQTLDPTILRNTDYTKVSAADTIYNRLTKLLTYLRKKYPEEGWGGFLDETGAPNWSRIVVAGHSQGGGNAALIGKQHLVARVVMISSPPDGCFESLDKYGDTLPLALPGCADPITNPLTVPGALWTGLPGLTPADRYYGLAHESEFAITPMLENWGRLGLYQFGNPVVREDSAPPYGCTHMLLTRRPPLKVPGIARSLYAHRLTVRNGFTPTDETGVPLLRDAWRYISAVSPGSLSGCNTSK